ncbi:MAG: ribulose-phosphate 3-epimerase [Candidatus Thermoplasmatota archaeon]|jgi:ribulose-phosphate 3-epimerase|nr:ribulose-phosphate 3-epimerase [Candidatus Thermoplasmatota archaeon]
MIRLSPSILSADLYCLRDGIDRVRSCGVDMLHVDVMDGHFVPNITFGLPLVSSLRKHTDMELDVHLMISDPAKYAPLFVKAGADIVTIHAESQIETRETLRSIRYEGAKPGITINPNTPLDSLFPYLEQVEQVLVMSVQAGFGGQSFIPSSLKRIRELSLRLSENGLKVPIEVDGGIGPQNAMSVVEAGADILVAGSSIFSTNDGDIEGNIRALTDAVRQARNRTS